MNERYVLTHSLCRICVWGENGFYNPMCAHCRYVTYSKQEEPQLMTRATAEMLGLVDKNYAETVDTVKHGMWKRGVRHSRSADCDIGICSVCGNEEIGIIANVIKQNPYCRVCGAKMDEK